MTHELIAVVDENDQFIENKPRKEVHQLGLCHRAVHILLFNQENKLFLQKRSAHKDVNAGLWDTSAAGHVDADESYEHCAQRETQEELGVCVQETLTPLFKLPPQKNTGMEFIQVYQCNHEGPFTLEVNEIDDGQWFSFSEIAQRVKRNDPSLTETFKIIFSKLPVRQ